MTTDEAKTPLTVATIAEDLSLSNDEGTSWYGYELGVIPDSLFVKEYGDEGEVVGTYVVRCTIEKQV